MTARRIVARVVRKAPAACASLSKPRVSRVEDKGLRGQNRVGASNALVHRHREVNSAENEITWEPKKLWIKAGKISAG